MLPWKKWFESKSIWLGLLTLTVSLLSLILDTDWIRDYPNFVATLGTVVGILTIILRYVTGKPMKLTMNYKEGITPMQRKFKRRPTIRKPHS